MGLKTVLGIGQVFQTSRLESGQPLKVRIRIAIYPLPAILPIMEANKRIDAGIKRGPRKQIDRNPRAAKTGLFLPKFSPEQRQRIVQEAYSALQAGESTNQIAERLSTPEISLTGRALRYWLMDDPQAELARQAMIHGELTRTLEEMREAKYSDSPLPLACAREEFRAWSWIADRRLPKLWGQTQRLEVNDISAPKEPGLIADAVSLLEKIRDHRQEKLLPSNLEITKEEKT